MCKVFDIMFDQAATPALPTARPRQPDQLYQELLRRNAHNLRQIKGYYLTTRKI